MNQKTFCYKRFLKKVKTDNTHEYFNKVFVALSAQTGCPQQATDKYLRLLHKRLLGEKSSFLKTLASLPILGLRVLGCDLPSRIDYGLKVRKGPFPDLFKWHFRALEQLSKKAPSPTRVLKARRILTLLSIGKMLKISTNQRIKKEYISYAKRVQKTVNYERASMLHELYGHEISEFLEFVSYESRVRKQVTMDIPNAVFKENRVRVDPTSYSLKSLAKPIPVKYRVGFPMVVAIHLYWEEQFEYWNDPDEIYGRQHILVEHGGKYRGITPYYGPLVHSSSVYAHCRALLSGWFPDVSLDQSIGHARTAWLTTQGKTVISADASNFTDSIDLDLAHAFLRCIRQEGFLEFLQDLTISTACGDVRTPLPLMGLKGCYELSCCLLAYSVWRQAKKFKTLKLRKMAHACDDLVGFGTFEGFSEAYQFIGASLNPKKTVVSKTSAVFCGQMYWHGHRVTPVRISISKLAESTSGTEVLPMCREFLTNASPVWGPKAFKVVSKLIKSACLRCVPPNCVRFDLPAKLGGVPVDLRRSISLDKLLDSKKTLKYTLYNVPVEEVPRDARSFFVGLLRFGQPAKQPDGTILPSVTIPEVVKSNGWRRRKLAINRKIEGGVLSKHDVLAYYYYDIKIVL